MSIVAAHLLVQRPRVLDVFRRDVRCRQTDGDAFEHGECLDGLGVPVEVDAGDRGADVAGVRDVALRLEPPDRLTHRDDTDVHLSCEVLDDEPFTGRALAVEHTLTDEGVGAVGLRSRCTGSRFGLEFRQAFLDRLHASESLSLFRLFPGMTACDGREAVG